MSEHVQEEDGKSLESVEDGEDPGKDNGCSADYEQCKDPGHT